MGFSISLGKVSGPPSENPLYEVAAKEGWKVEELHTEEGRLDEVFRSITMPDTATLSEEKK